MKKLMSIAISLLLLFNMSVPVLAVQDDTELTTMDILAVAHMYLASNDLWPDVVCVEYMVPLYNTHGEHVAWYVEFTSGAYAVVNNDSTNPCAVEFGIGGNELIHEILDKDDNAYIVYTNPTYVISGAISTISIDDNINVVDFYDEFPQLAEVDSDSAAMLVTARQEIARYEYVASPMNDDGDYGFITWSELPVKTGTSNSLDTSNVGQWAVMSTFNSIASNHCAATCATNVTLYFASMGCQVLENSSTYDTFAAIHAIVGNGPVYSFASGLASYFRSKGYTLGYTNGIDTYTEVQSAISRQHPCSILLCNSLMNWHQVMCYGWFNTTGGDEYLKIVTGWDNNVSYYLINGGSTWSTGVEFFVQ